MYFSRLGFGETTTRSDDRDLKGALFMDKHDLDNVDMMLAAKNPECLSSNRIGLRMLRADTGQGKIQTPITGREDQRWAGEPTRKAPSQRL